ncbi:MAG: AbrB/MazE/SpoVT family DNA-binding domain-containing protein [Rhizobiaceae bacterium]|nr:AbrB/MazE/SpoVT family DNA-binding domain-containing protein [Rhizobiaceae bacterium]
MPTLTVTAKGQVTLKKDVLKHLGVKPGDKVELDLLPGGEVALRPERPNKKHDISELFGMFYDPNGPKLTIEEIKTATEEAWAGIREDRSRHESDTQDAAE